MIFNCEIWRNRVELVTRPSQKAATPKAGSATKGRKRKAQVFDFDGGDSEEEEEPELMPVPKKRAAISGLP